MNRALDELFEKLRAWQEREATKNRLRNELIDAARALRDERRERFVGPTPPWWRLFARDEWHDRVREAATMRITEDDLCTAAFAMGSTEVFNVLDSVLAVVRRWESGR